MSRFSNLLKYLFIPAVFFLNSCEKPKNLEYKYLLSRNDEKVIGMYNNRIITKNFGNEAIDETLKNSIEKMKNEILIKTNNKHIIVKIFIFNSETLNAFTSIDGYVYFSTAIIKLLTKQELYALLCHEIAHIISRDNSEIYSLSILYKDLKVTRNKINSIILSKSEKDNLYFKKYIMKKRRYNEYKADKIALDLLSKSGYDKNFLILWLKKMEKYYKAVTGPARAFSTHPNIKDRIERAEALINKSIRKNASTKISLGTD